MVAFSSLFTAIHEFCNENHVKPQAFYHDRQNEFGSSMKEFHKLFASGFAIEKEGVYTRIVPTNHQFGRFTLPSSANLAGLQLVDLLLWLSRRKTSPEIDGTLERLKTVTDYSYMSRAWSETVRYIWTLAESQ